MCKHICLNSMGSIKMKYTTNICDFLGLVAGTHSECEFAMCLQMKFKDISQSSPK